jgi:rifampicin phosphotransferase
MTAVATAQYDAWDNLHGPSPADAHWSTDNVGEAAPGVLSPLGASIWSEIGDRATRRTFADIGALSKAEALPASRLEERVDRIFFGRLALKVEMLTLLGDRMPGASGQQVAEAIFGTIPDDIDYRPTPSRYPIVAWKLGRTFFGMPRRLERETPGFHRFWHTSVDAVANADLARARRLLAEAFRQFEEALVLQASAVLGHGQPMHQALAELIAAAGVGDIGVLSGSGGAEMAIITDIWRAAQGELSVEDVIREHGFHGPLEGEVSSTVWREDPAPLRHLVAEYAHREDPRVHAAQMRARLPAAQAEVLAALPRARRPGARLVLGMAAKRIPLRGVAKRSFVEGLDVIRACARRIGHELVDAGALGTPEDAFYLTMSELFDLPADAPDLVARRRERRAAYEQISVPGHWKGDPVPVVRDATGGHGSVDSVSGIGVSAGVTEGVARVVTDPSFAEVEPDEILVASTTDPSWASVMFISSALVMDLGGPLSHAAVVARELGLPCVVNTRTGTRDIRTGDRVRVDGTRGAVEIVERAG